MGFSSRDKLSKEVGLRPPLTHPKILFSETGSLRSLNEFASDFSASLRVALMKDPTGPALRGRWSEAHLKSLGFILLARFFRNFALLEFVVSGMIPGEL